MSSDATIYTPPEVIFDGHQVRKLGTMIRPLKRVFKKLSAANLPKLTWDEIRQRAEAKRRARDLFPNRDYIKDQKSHGSCNGQAAAGATERARVRRGQKHVKLSGTSMYSLINDGQDNGSALEDGMAKLDVGFLTEDECKWNDIYKDPRGTDPRRKLYRASSEECYQCDTELELATGLVCDFDAVVAVHAGNNFMRLDSRGIAGSDRGGGNHAVGVDDIEFIGNTATYDMYNSWNLTYGEDGRARLTWNQHLAGTVNNHRFYLIRSTYDNPEEENPPAV